MQIQLISPESLFFQQVHGLQEGISDWYALPFMSIENEGLQGYWAFMPSFGADETTSTFKVVDNPDDNVVRLTDVGFSLNMIERIAAFYKHYNIGASFFGSVKDLDLLYDNITAKAFVFVSPFMLHSSIPYLHQPVKLDLFDVSGGFVGAFDDSFVPYSNFIVDSIDEGIIRIAYNNNISTHLWHQTILDSSYDSFEIPNFVSGNVYHTGECIRINISEPLPIYDYEPPKNEEDDSYDEECKI